MYTHATSRGQGLTGDRWSEGSLFANPRADEQKSHSRPSARMSQPSMTKSTKGGHRVNAAVVWRQIVFLPGETCLLGVAGVPLWPACEAPRSAMAGGRRQESAEGIVAGGYFP